MNNESKTSEVLEAINTLNAKVDRIDAKVDRIDAKVDRIDAKVDSQAKDTDERFNDVLEAVNNLSTQMDERFGGVEQRLTKVETTMVTKDYLDDKLYDLRGDLVVLMRKEDKKVQSLVELLHTKKVISEKEAARILSMDLFPQISLQ